MSTKKKTHKPAEDKPSERDIEELSEFIAAVLTHPATPGELYNRIIDGLNECDTTTNAHHHAGYVKAILIEHAKRGGE